MSDAGVRTHTREYATSLAERLAYAGFPLGTNILTMLGLTFLSVFYTDTVGLSTGAVAALFLAVKMWGAASDPLFGGIADRVRPPRGKFKFWVSGSVLLLPLATLLVFLNPGLGAAGNLAYACVTCFLWGAAGTVSGVPHSALVTSLTGNPRERTTLISMGTFTGILGSVAAGVAGGPAVERLGFIGTVLAFGAPALLVMAPVHFLAKERVLHPASDRATLNSTFRAIVKNKYLIAFCCSFICLSGSSFALSIGTYFVKWNLGNLDLMAVVMIGSFLPVAVLPIALPRLVRLFGKRKLYAAGLVLGIAFSVVQYFAGYGSLPLFLLLNAVKVVGVYLPVTMAGMFTADCAEYGASVTGKRNEAVTFSIQALSNKLAGAVSGSLSIFLLGLFGYDGAAQVQTRAALDGIWLLITLLPAIGMAVALLVFLLFYKLEEEDVARLMGEAEARGKAPRRTPESRTR